MAVVFKTPLLARTSSEKVAMPVTPRVEVNVVAPVTFKVLFKIVFKLTIPSFTIILGFEYWLFVGFVYTWRYIDNCLKY